MSVGLIGIIVTLAITAASSLIWTVRQEGRINTHDVMFKERERYDQLRAEENDRRHTENHNLLERIDRKVDGLLNVIYAASGPRKVD